MQITIDRQALKAVSRFAASKDIRYYLCGVYVESSPLETRLSATDGHALVVHRADANNVGSWKGIIPIDTIKSLLKIKLPKYAKHDLVTVTDTANPNEYRAQVGNEALIFTPIDGVFPDYRKIIPNKISGDLAHYDPELLMKVKEASECLGSKKGLFAMGHNGEGAGIAEINSDCMALVMPMRASMLADCATIEWARAELKMPDAPDNVVPIENAA